MRLQCRRPWFYPWVGKMCWRRHRLPTPIFSGFTCGSAGKQSAHNVGDQGSISGLGKIPGEGKGYPLQYSDLENSMDYIVHGIAKSRTRLNNFHFFFKVLFLLEYSRLTMLCRFQVDSKGLSHTYICIHSSPNSPPIQATT